MALTMRADSVSRETRDLMLVAPYRAMTAEEEARLRDRMISGDLAARDALILQCSRIVRKCADRAWLVRESDRDDLECELLLKLTRVIELFDPTKGRLSTFAVNTCLRHSWHVAKLMNKRREYQSGEDDDERWLYPAPEESEWRHDEDVVALGLAVLTPPRRRVIQMRYYEHMTLDQCAQRLGVTRERVRQIESRAIRDIRERLGVRLDPATTAEEDKPAAKRGRRAAGSSPSRAAS